MKVSVVIPNFNGLHLLRKNLPSVCEVFQNHEIIIVDDASTDESVAFVKSNFTQIKIIQKKQNEGFSSTVNQGVGEAMHEFVVLLNTDVSPQNNLLGFVEKYFEDPEVFAVGFLQNCLEESKIIKRGRGIGSFHHGFLVHARGEIDKKDTLWVSGGAGIFRKSIWQKLGGLQSLYNPFYWEDIDLSYRALKSGYKLFFEKQAIVMHDQKIGAIRSKFSSFQIKSIAYRNQIFFVWLNITDSSYLRSHYWYLCIQMMKSLIFFDFAFHNGLLKAILSSGKIGKVHTENVRSSKLRDNQII